MRLPWCVQPLQDELNDDVKAAILGAAAAWLARGAVGASADAALATVAGALKARPCAPKSHLAPSFRLGL
jgi:hypothetical protein